MKIEIKSYANNSSLVSAVLFFILGAIMFTNPDTMVIAVSKIFGGILILFGLYSCIKNYILVKEDGNTSSLPMIMAYVGCFWNCILLCCRLCRSFISFHNWWLDFD